MEHKIKQRLVGAVVLVSLAVIFIPLILEGPDDEWSPPLQSMPQAPDIEYPAIADLALPEPADMQEELVEEDAEPLTPPSGEAKARTGTVTEPAPAGPETPAATPLAPPPPADSELRAGWYVQVGSFGNRENAARRRDLLAGKGFDVSLQENTTTANSTWRVLVGPSATRDDGVQAQRRLGSAHDISGIVIHLPD